MREAAVGACVTDAEAKAVGVGAGVGTADERGEKLPINSAARTTNTATMRARTLRFIGEF